MRYCYILVIIKATNKTTKKENRQTKKNLTKKAKKNRVK